jgi:phospholipid/cholesterol/gamma-HCH transport system permease protein
VEPSDHGVRLVLAGRFDLEHVVDVEQALSEVRSQLGGATAVAIDVDRVELVDGAGATLIARAIDRLDADGVSVSFAQDETNGSVRLISLYRERRQASPLEVPKRGFLARVGAAAAQAPITARAGFNFIGEFVAAIPKSVKLSTVNWRSLPDLLQRIGADGLPVTAAANLLVGLIIGFMGVVQLRRFGAVSFVPELVVVAHFRELGPLVTAVIVAGRTGAGIASELGTMKVSEEIDALRTMGFDPIRWLVFPRCLALVVTLPLLVWIGDAMAVIGGMLATVALSDMTAYTYLTTTADVITSAHFLAGMIKTPVLALAIGMIATAQGLATRGGAAAVGTRTTSAVVLSMIAVILLSSMFTLFFAFAGF